MSEEKIIHEFQKNIAEKVRISFTTFKGKKLVNLRIYYNAADEGEDWRPTPKGLSLRREQVLELKEAIDKAAEEYEKELSGLDKKGEDNAQADEKQSGACTNGGGHGPDQDIQGRATREGQAEGTADE